MYSGARAHTGAQETLRRGAGACQGTNLTAKRGIKAPFVAKFGVHAGKKVPCRAWGRVWWGVQKSPMSHVGECGVSEKKGPREGGGGSPTRVYYAEGYFGVYVGRPFWSK